MSLTNKDASKAEIVFRIQEILDELTVTSQRTKYHILYHTLLERYGVSFTTLSNVERGSLILEHSMGLEHVSESKDT